MAIKNYRQSGFDHYLHRTRRIPEGLQSNFMSPVDTAAEFSRGSLSGQGLIPLTVDTNQVAGLAITTPKVDTDAITNPKMADDSVGTDEVIDGSITKDKQSIGFSPNLMPEKYAGFEFFNNNDDVGTMTLVTPGAASFDSVFEHDNYVLTSEAGGWTGRRGLAYDAILGRLWCVFCPRTAAGPYDLYVAYSDDEGASWTTEVVATGTVYGTSLVLDSGGVPHLILRTSTRVYYTYRTGVDSWNAIENIIDATDWLTVGVSSAIDSSDTIHLVYGRNPQGAGGIYNRISYVTGTSGSWSSPETVIEKEITTAYEYHHKESAGLVLDSNEIPHVIYRSREDAGTSSLLEIMYTNRIGGSWITPETVQGIDGTVGFSDPVFDLDSSDNLHVVYKNNVAFGTGDKWRIFYSSRQTAEANWATNKETVKSDNSASTPFNTIAMAVDKSDKVKVIVPFSNDACYSYRESAEADWANNWVDLTGGSYDTVKSPNLLSSLYPFGNRYASGVAFTFLQVISTGSDEHLVFCDNQASFSFSKATTDKQLEGLKGLATSFETNDALHLAGTVIGYNIPLEASTKYILSAFVRAPVADTITIKIKQDNGNLLTPVSAEAVGTGWTRVYGTFTTEAGVEEALVKIEGDGYFWFDCFMVEKASVDAISPEPSEWKASSLTTRALDNLSDVTIT